MGKLDFSLPIYVLAPLAGFTDLPFRSVVKKFGADLTVSEMISSNALVHNSSKTYKMLQKAPNEEPYAVQIAGNDKDIVKEAVLILNDIEGIDIIDLNCGCPVPKVVRSGGGSALLKDLKKMGEIIETIKKYSEKEYTSVKVRIGFDEKIPEKIAKVCESAGADFITVHGRTRSGGFKAPVDYDAIKRAKESVSIPVIANGDITSYEKAEWVLEYTKTDGVMIGRGAIGKPWIFYQLKHKTSDISPEIKKEIIVEHFDKMIEFYGDYGAVMFRKHLHTYSKGYQGASAFRDKINRITDPKEMRKLIIEFF
ncbi:tRNA dihydrouridine synthase DusB [Nitrosophilus alvini]|uniref:tRNA dihydrouridine synthase DusB n=1 Tax=Nitrosophilus alvini TaxID=2714855 RepID=UPI00190CB5CF|nr:tRNA dihydrouridine synthase DusB [Nitrosophilus alvini]